MKAENGNAAEDQIFSLDPDKVINYFKTTDCFKNNHRPFALLLEHFCRANIRISRQTDKVKDKIFLKRIENLQRISNDYCNEVDRLKLILLEKEEEILSLRKLFPKSPNNENPILSAANNTENALIIDSTGSIVTCSRCNRCCNTNLVNQEPVPGVDDGEVVGLGGSGSGSTGLIMGTTSAQNSTSEFPISKNQSLVASTPIRPSIKRGSHVLQDFGNLSVIQEKRCKVRDLNVLQCRDSGFHSTDTCSASNFEVNQFTHDSESQPVASTTTKTANYFQSSDSNIPLLNSQLDSLETGSISTSTTASKLACPDPDCSFVAKDRYFQKRHYLIWHEYKGWEKGCQYTCEACSVKTTKMKFIYHRLSKSCQLNRNQHKQSRVTIEKSKKILLRKDKAAGAERNNPDLPIPSNSSRKQTENRVADETEVDDGKGKVSGTKLSKKPELQ